LFRSCPHDTLILGPLQTAHFSNNKQYTKRRSLTYTRHHTLRILANKLLIATSPTYQPRFSHISPSHPTPPFPNHPPLHVTHSTYPTIATSTSPKIESRIPLAPHHSYLFTPPDPPSTGNELRPPPTQTYCNATSNIVPLPFSENLDYIHGGAMKRHHRFCHPMLRLRHNEKEFRRTYICAISLSSFSSAFEGVFIFGEICAKDLISKRVYILLRTIDRDNRFISSYVTHVQLPGVT
jgi:hypothetical protein